MELNIDKTGWKNYRFDEFAQNISQRVEPKQTDLEIYVGLEHLDPDNLHIKRNGTPADVEGTKLKFYNGDVIFGKRRAYQRKAVLAETDGICSAHAMVLRANTKLIDERLFPFFFHSKVFQDISVKISVGGLSPTINWKDLAKQEFLLPPKDQQARLAELLWSADEVVEREMEVKEKNQVVLSTLINEELIDETKKTHKIEDVCDVKSGFGFPIKYQGRKDMAIPFFKVSDMNKAINQVYLRQSENYIDYNILDIIKAKVYPKLSLVFPKIGATIYTDKKRLLAQESIVDNNVMVLIPNNDLVNSHYLYYFFSTFKLETLINNGAVPSISAETVKNISFPLHSLSMQNDICNKILMVEELLESNKNQITFSKQLKQGLINEIF
jgi:type I restriction enzyme, S subunit